jgi:membrane protein YqaA with SNARE-associated domain
VTRDLTGAVVALLWAVAEATVWPIMPDAVLVPLALRRPRSWWHLVLGATVGTTIGGWVSYRIGRHHPDRRLIEQLPLVRPAMVGAAAGWLEEHGPRGALRQMATGVPFKVFARLAGMRRMRLVPFLAWAVAGRSVRFVLLAGAAALLSRLCPTLVARRYWLLTLFWVTGFSVALWRTVRFWEQRSQPFHHWRVAGRCRSGTLCHTCRYAMTRPPGEVPCRSISPSTVEPS